MNVQPWLLVAAALLVVGHGVVALFVYRLYRDDGLPDVGAGAANASTGAVDCPECGAENDGQYRFCRECSAELPGGLTGGREDGGRSRVL